MAYTQNWDSKGNIYYTDENGQVVNFKVNPFTQLANKAKATAYNVGSWINETNPNSEAYKQKVSAILGLTTAPMGLGTALTGGIAKGLVPIVGRKIAQNMAQGISSGVVGGAIGGGAEAGLNDRNIAIGGLQGATVGGLLGGLGGYGLGKVAQKLNTQTVWHGSPYKFDRFSNEAIGTGEGAQAHGYGHYAAKNKDVAQSYADRLSNQIEDEIKTITYDGIPYEYKYGTEILSDPKKPFLADVYANRDDYRQVVKNYLDMYDKNLKQYDDPNYLEFLKAIGDKSDTSKVVANLKNMQNFVKNFDINKLERNTNKQLYKLSIPKDDVMLRELAPYNEQPKAVQKALREIIKEEFNATPKSKDFETYVGLLNNAREGVLEDSLRLQNKGIKGISYNGGIDGEANVIFNPDDIDIIPYYDNPTSFKEKFINLLNR